MYNVCCTLYIDSDKFRNMVVAAIMRRPPLFGHSCILDEGSQLATGTLCPPTIQFVLAFLVNPQSPFRRKSYLPLVQAKLQDLCLENFWFFACSKNKLHGHPYGFKWVN